MARRLQPNAAAGLNPIGPVSIRTLVVDDEPLARRKLEDALATCDDFQLVGQCGCGRDAVTFLRSRPVDLVLLDVHMPDLDGFSVLEQLGDEPPFVIFVTAFDEHAVRAFEVHALDYLLKPFDLARFQAALERVRRADRGAQRERLQALRADRNETLTLRAGKGSIFLRQSEMLWFRAARNYVYVHTADATHLVRDTLTSLEAKLAPERFCRIHRSLIVHLDAVRSIHPAGSGEYAVHLTDGTVLKSGRQFRKALGKLARSSD